MLGEGYQGPENIAIAREITSILGGLPLALNQISTYIRQQKITLDEFLPLYKKHQRAIHRRRPTGFDYVFTISSLWKLALEKLSGDAATLLNLVTFFDPEQIDESMLCKGAKGLEASGKARELVFMSDELEWVLSPHGLE
jgi:hypothetical protein